MRWLPLSSSGSSWWLQNDAGVTQGYVVKVKGCHYIPIIMGGSKDTYLRVDTLEEAQEQVLVWLAEKKLDGGS